MKMVEPANPKRMSFQLSNCSSSVFMFIRPFVDFPGNIMNPLSKEIKSSSRITMLRNN